MVKSFLLILVFVTVISMFAIISMIKFATEIDDGNTKRPATKFAKELEFSKEVGVIRLRINHSHIASKRFPYMVAITAGARSRGWSFSCFGSIIRPQWVITAAHCKIPDQAHRVLLYSDYMKNRTLTHLIVYWKVHEGYKRNNSLPKYDIAVAKLAAGIPALTQVAVLANVKAEQVQASVWKTVIAMDQTTYLTNDLDTYSFSVTKHQKCYEQYGLHLDSTLFCIDMSSHTDCFVTEFGPIFSKKTDVIVGLLAVKPSNCDKKMAVFTNVSSYADWVVKATSGTDKGKTARVA